MIRGQAPTSAASACPTAVAELIGMELGRQPRRRAGGEDAPRLVDRERGALDEDVAAAGEPLARDRGNQLVDQQ